MASSSSPLNASSLELGLGPRKPDFVKFSSVKEATMQHASRRIKRKWQSREERRIDKEFDLVLVSSDGECVSVSDSENSDCSIGWYEHHSPDFLRDGKPESSIAVLVRCYWHGHCELVENSMSDLQNAIYAGSKKCIEEWEEWLSSFRTAEVEYSTDL